MVGPPPTGRGARRHLVVAGGRPVGASRGVPYRGGSGCRARALFGILRELVVWENSNDERVLDDAKAEIRKSMGDDLPPLLDPFAGGGAIPLEAQRLGLEAYAQDLNPVAVAINKAMIEIPPLFAGKPAVNPESRSRANIDSWVGNNGLVADVNYYGSWMKEEAYRRIGTCTPRLRCPMRKVAARRPY